MVLDSTYNGEVNKKLKTKPGLLKFCDFMKGEEPCGMKKQTKAAKTKLESERTLQSMLKDKKIGLG